MDFVCPHCANAQHITDISNVAIACGHCEKPIYFPLAGHFPPIVAVSFSHRSSEAMPLLAFFHTATLTVPPEWSGSAPPPTSEESEHIDVDMSEEAPPAATPPPLDATAPASNAFFLPPPLSVPDREASVADDDIARTLGFTAPSESAPEPFSQPGSTPPPAPASPTPGRLQPWLIGVAALTLSAALAWGIAASLETSPSPRPLKPREPTPALVASAPASQPAPSPREAAIDLYNRGNKYYLENNYADAVTAYEQALSIDSSFALAYRGLGVTYAKQAKAQQAITAYKNYLKLAPDARDAAQVQKIIENAEK